MLCLMSLCLDYKLVPVVLAVDGVPLDGVLAQAQVEGIVTHGLSSVAVQQQLLAVVHQILDGALRGVRLVGKRLARLVEVGELTLQVLDELALVAKNKVNLQKFMPDSQKCHLSGGTNLCLRC